MRPSQLSTLLARTITARLPILLIGGPGIGKTSIVEQAAAAADADLVISHPAVADPTDAKGFPWAEKGAKTATFLPFGETAKVLAAKRPTVWFLDDLGQAPPAVQASFMPWLLARQVNGHRLPDEVTIISATNRRTDRAGVSGILEPVKSRFAAIVELTPDLDEWCEWALGPGAMPPELVAFLRFQPDLLYQFKASADLVNCPTPRTWANAGQLLRLQLPATVEAAALNGAVGEGAATALAAFLQMFRQLPNIDGILMDPDASDIPQAVNVLYAVSTAVAARATAENFGRVSRYAERLMESGRGEFAALVVRDATRRTPATMQTPAFVKLMSGDLGRMVGGSGA
jgi:ATPase family associated with various cellular activities (AAA)